MLDEKATEWRWPHFTREEMACKCCGKAEMDPDFMDRLEVIRGNLGRPMKITSGYRCPDHNDKVSNTGRDGPHTTGRACDIAVSGARTYYLVFEAICADMSGIGIKQKGDHNKRFVHLDDLYANRPRPRIWTY